MSLMRLGFLCLLIFLAACTTTSSGLSGLGSDRATTPCCETCENIPVTRVIDGDTFVSGPFRVRLFGVDTPEVGERCWTLLLGLRSLAGDNVRVEAGPRTEDSFGRLLDYVYTDAGDSIDETLVSEGLAVAWTRDGQDREFWLMWSSGQGSRASGVCGSLGPESSDRPQSKG